MGRVYVNATPLTSNFPRRPQSLHCSESWAQASKQITEDDVVLKEIASRYIKVGNMEIKAVNIHELTPLTVTDAMVLIKESPEIGSLL